MRGEGLGSCVNGMNGAGGFCCCFGFFAAREARSR